MFLRVLRTAKATLSRSFYLDEVEQAAAGSVNVAVTRLDGTLVESGVAAADGQGGYTYEFGGSDVVDLLALTWSLTVGGDAVVLDQDRIEVVGGFYFGLVEARNIDSVLQDPVRHPTDKLIEKRVETEDECERITGQAWVPRFCRETVSGSGATALVLKWPLVRKVRAVSVSGVAYAAPVVEAFGYSDSGLLSRDAGWPVGRRNIVIEYEHGHDVPAPEIVRAAKLRFKSLMLEGSSAMPDTAERRVVIDDRGGSTVYAAPGVGRTGIPAVDAVYGAHPDPRPGFG